MENLVLTNTNLQSIKKSLIDGLTIASGAKSSATYYHSRDEQIDAIKAQIDKMYNLSKELPLIVAAQKGATGTFISGVLLNEFKRGSNGGACNIVNPIDWYDNNLSDKAILTALRNLGEDAGITYVLRLFLSLKKEHVNNERARKIMLGYIWNHPNLEFVALKYRNKLAEILEHIYGKRFTSILLSIASKQIGYGKDFGVFINGKELNMLNDNVLRYLSMDSTKALKIFMFIFKKETFIIYSVLEFPLINAYKLAKTDITLDRVSAVPEEILLGLISSPKHPQYNTMWSTKAQRESTKALIRSKNVATSANQQVRQTKSTAKLGVVKEVNLEKVTDFLALYKTGFETCFTNELHNAIDALAEKKKINGFYYNNIGILVDDSKSMSGNKLESKNTPKSIADFTNRVLRHSAKTSKYVVELGVNTNLASGFIKLLKKEDPNKRYDAIFILTDGYENSYDGLLNEVISIYNNETDNIVPIFQISPITGAEMGANVRTIGDSVIAMAINNPSAIMPQLTARLLEVDTKRWLSNQVLMLSEAQVSRVNKLSK